MLPTASMLCLALATTLAAHAAEPTPATSDAQALSLADRPAAPATEPRPWRLFIEAGGGRDGSRGGVPSSDATRAALDLRYDGLLAPGLRGVFSDRFDHVRRGEPRDERSANALREAYVSWERAADVILDAGRINVRHGAAWGFNPTDYFRADAVRTFVSPDPASLRENRQGTVALRGHALWPDSALSVTMSPRLTRRSPSDDTWSLDLGATNRENRWLVAASHKFGERFNPELLLHGGPSTSTQLGLNASVLASSATVAFVEASVGRDRSLAAQALEQAEPRHTHRRAAVGATYTTAFDLSLTAEADYSSAAPDRAEWDALGAPQRLRLLDAAQRLQELPVRRALFFYATWTNALVRRLDVSAFVRHDPVTHGRAQWLETRWRADRFDVALQWQVFSGRPGSVFGSVPQARTVELSLRLFL